MKKQKTNRARGTTSRLVTGLFCFAALAILASPIGPSKPSVSSEIVSARTSSSENRRPSEITDHTERQGYIDALLEGTDLPFCSGVIYDHDSEALIGYTADIIRDGLEREQARGTLTRPLEVALREKLAPVIETYRGNSYGLRTSNIPQLDGEGRESPIFVGRMYFEIDDYDSFTATDFAHMIGVHEQEHVLQHAQGQDFVSVEELAQGIANGSIRHPILYELVELDATHAELRSISETPERFSDAYVAFTRASYERHRARLQHVLPRATQTERTMINRAFDLYSQPELVATADQ